MVRKFTIATAMLGVLAVIGVTGCSDPKTVVPDNPKGLIKASPSKSKDMAPPPPPPPPPGKK